MSATNGLIARPRPWTFAAMAPPSERRSAPVCFCAKLQAGRASRLLLQVAEDGRPLDAGLELDQPAVPVEVEDATETARVEEEAALAELLAAHRMPAAGDRHREPALARAGDGLAQGVERIDLVDLSHSRLVELRVDVVYVNHGVRRPEQRRRAWPAPPRRTRPPRSRPPRPSPERCRDEGRASRDGRRTAA